MSIRTQKLKRTKFTNSGFYMQKKLNPQMFNGISIKNYIHNENCDFLKDLKKMKFI